MTGPSHSPPSPYLSVVVASRNDNHGGDLLERMQTFINALAVLSDRFSLPLELIVVEWNPPQDRPRLAEVLHWPESQMCSYRIIEVPPAVHQQYRVCGKELPLFQMIAKNVGIRRARGEFVLATNIDLIFSEELMRWLASRKLKPGASYRVNRYDVPLDVMKLKEVDAQLQYARKHLIRINTCHGTVDADIFFPAAKPKKLPGQPGSRSKGQQAATKNAVSKRAAKPQKTRRRRQWLPWTLLFEMDYDLPYFIHRARRHLYHSQGCFHEAFEKRSFSSFMQGLVLAGKSACRLGRLNIRVAKLLVEIRCRRVLQFFGSLGLFQLSVVQKIIKAIQSWLKPKEIRLHTNACGDFTLLAKSDWHRLRGYVEWDIFSWHLDSLFLFVAHAAGIKQEILPCPLYHIEHCGGWTPESADHLFSRLREKGIPYLTTNDLKQHQINLKNGPQSCLINDESWGLENETLPERSIGLKRRVLERAA